jgi:hypothetical protein
MLREREQAEVVADHFAVHRQGLRECARVRQQPVAQERGKRRAPDDFAGVRPTGRVNGGEYEFPLDTAPT